MPELIAGALRLAVCAYLLLACSLDSLAADLWQWSPPATHHAAAVTVRSLEPTGHYRVGSGIYVAVGELRGVLTVRHVLVGGCEVIWQDGQRSSGEARCDRDGFDVAWIAVQRDDVQPVELAAAQPSPGEPVEYVTLGGPERRLRHFWGTATGESLGRDVVYDACVVSGDSGGAILDRSGRLVGIQSIGSGTSVSDQWPIYPRSGSAPHAAIAAFVARVAATAQTQCGPGGCPVPYRVGGVGMGVGIGVGRIQMYPPAQPRIVAQPVTPAPSPAPPVVVSPPVPQPDPCQPIREEIAAMRRDLKALADRPPVPGPPGPAGKDGRDGQQGPPGPATAPVAMNYDEAAAEIQRRLPPFRVLVLDRDGKTKQEITVPIGGTLPLQLIPHR